MTSRRQEYIVEPLRVELTVVFKQITEFEFGGRMAGLTDDPTAQIKHKMVR